MKVSIFKHAVLLLMLAGSFFPCCQQEEKEERNHSDPIQLSSCFWVYDFIKKCLESGFHGRIYQCTYRDGRGFLIESYENADTLYSLWNCEGIVVYEGEDKPIQKIYPELNIEIDILLCGICQVGGGCSISMMLF